jgi:hypothetical protein
VGLIAAALEEKGIQTVCLSNMEEIMAKVVPPRWLALPFPLGYPLGKPHDAHLQRSIILRAFRLLDEEGPGPVRQVFNQEEER